MNDLLDTPPSVAEQGFQFKADATIQPDKQTRLVIKVFGGPVGLLQALVADVNDVMKNGIGFDQMGSPLSTGATGAAAWDFMTTGCAGGYVKWRVTVMASAANLGGFHVVEELWQDETMVLSTRVDGALPNGQMLTSFVNGVLVAR